MKRGQLFIKSLLLLGLLIGMPVEGLAKKQKKSSQILQRIYDYQKANNSDIDSLEDRVYAKFRFNVEKRNIFLQFIPSMYPIAKDPREYIRESYTKVLFQDSHNYDIENQVVSSTIRRNRRAMSPLLDYMTPNIYDVALYEGHMLSPFNHHNKRYYRFTDKRLNDSTSWLEFKPKFYNTQLLNGYALVETATGRIIMTMLNGEYDMISFRTNIEQGNEGGRSLMPKRISTVGTFRFMGNRISTVFDADYDIDSTLPEDSDSLPCREVMEQIRPMPLSIKDQEIYAAYDAQQKADSLKNDTTPQKKGFWKKFLFDTIGDNLITPIEAESHDASISLSPIINPLYLSYSDSRGWRYKMKLRTRYAFNKYRYITLNPTFGYNFKQQQFYFTAPLRVTYNPKRNGYAELVWGNGQPISNASVKDMLSEIHQDTIDFDKTDIDKFKDNYLQVFNNIMLFDWLDIETGIVYHHRRAIEKALLREYDMPVTYRSFAPVLGLKFLPWLNRGPLIAIDYERAIKGVLGSNLDYERWELDAQWKKKTPGLRVLNLRAGCGFYTATEKYFVDYENFRDENLPEGWDDDWSGDFQLLSGREYNRSSYYIRGNISYESPMMLATWIPYLGKFIEKERFYLSGVQLERSRLYSEIGYGFTNRYISVGAFASFRNTRFDRLGVEVDIELFKRW